MPRVRERFRLQSASFATIGLTTLAAVAAAIPGGGCSQGQPTSPPPPQPTVATFSGTVTLDIPDAANATVWFNGQQLGVGSGLRANLSLAVDADRLLMAQAPGGRTWAAFVSNRGGRFYGTSINGGTITVSALSTADALVHLAPQLLSPDSTLNAVVADGITQTPAVDAVASWLTAHPTTQVTVANADFVALVEAAVVAAGPAIVSAISNAGASGELGSSSSALTTPTTLYRFGTWGEGDVLGVWAGPVTVGWHGLDKWRDGLDYELGGPNGLLPAWAQLSSLSLDYVVTFNEVDKHEFSGGQPTACTTAADCPSGHLCVNDACSLDLGTDRLWPLVAGSEVLGSFKPQPFYELANPLGLVIDELAKLAVPTAGASSPPPSVALDHYGTYSVRFFSGAITSERLGFVQSDTSSDGLAMRWQQAFWANMLKGTLKLASTLVSIPDNDQEFAADLAAGLAPIFADPQYAIDQIGQPGRFDAFAVEVTQETLAVCGNDFGKAAANDLAKELGDALLGTPSKIVDGLTTVGVTSQMVSMPAIHSIVLTAGPWSDCETNADCASDATCGSDSLCHFCTGCGMGGTGGAGTGGSTAGTGGASTTTSAATTASNSSGMGGVTSTSSGSSSTGTSSSSSGAACSVDSDCATGPCNVCPASVQLCLAPLAPVASLVAGACKSALPACHFSSPRTCGPLGTFGAGIEPYGIVFDGTNMWVANMGSNNVTELSPTGATLGTFAVGPDPVGIAFDRTNMWVTNGGSDNVTELSPTGTVLGTFTVGTEPEGIAFDGVNMWVANFSSNNVTKLSPTGAVLGTFTVGTAPYAIAFDGVNMWVANEESNNVTKLSPTGVALGTFGVGGAPKGIAFDGVNMWVANESSNTVTKLSPTGITLGTFPVGTGPYAIAFDGTNMWVTNRVDDTVTELSPSGAPLGTFAVGGAGPVAIAFDGCHMWVANGFSNSNTVTEL